MPDPPCALVVSDPADELAAATADALAAHGLDVRAVPTTALADLAVQLRGDAFSVEGRAVGAVVFRASPTATFSDGFVAEDRAFADAEVRATWLAALHLPSVFAVNRYDAAAWFEGVGWPVWRRLLMAADGIVSPFAFGDPTGEEPDPQRRWHPYRSHSARPLPGPATRRTLGAAATRAACQQVSLVVGGEVVAGASIPSVGRAATLLSTHGVLIAEVATDADGLVLLVDTLPSPAAVDTPRAAARLAELCHAHLRRR